MSTRSFICVEQDDGSYKGVYCHSDGYLTYNGAMLLDHYNSREKASEIIALGDLSLLCEKLYPDPERPHSFDYDSRQEDVTVAYGRDRGEKGTEAREITLEDAKESWCEYMYVFGRTENGVITTYVSMRPNCGMWKQTLPKNLRKWVLSDLPMNTAFSRNRVLTN